MIESSINEYVLEHLNDPSRSRVTHEVFRFRPTLSKLVIGVLIILSLRHYFEVFRAVIDLISVLVVNCHSLWNLTYKGSRYKPVDIMPSFLEVNTENRVQVSTRQKAGFNSSKLACFIRGIYPTSAGSQVSEVTHLVTRIAFNLLPSFNHILPVYQHGSMAARGA